MTVCLVALLCGLFAPRAAALPDKAALMAAISADMRSESMEQQLKAWPQGYDPKGKQALQRSLQRLKAEEGGKRQRVSAMADKVLRSKNINARNDRGATLLMLVAATGSARAVEMVLAEAPDCSVQDNSGNVALQYEKDGGGSALQRHLKHLWQQAFRDNDAEAVAHLLDCGVSPSTTVGEGNPPLGEAIERGLGNIFTELSFRPCVVTEVMRDGRTLTEVALQKGDAKALSYLLAFGAAADEPLSNGETPLRYLMNKGDVACATVFIKGAKIPNRTEGSTLGCLAARYSTPEMVSAVLKLAENPDAEDPYGNTPLLEAARRGHVAVYDAVLAANPASVWVNSLGESVLMHAALSGNPAMVERVLATMPAKLNGNKDKKGKTALDYAALLPQNPAMPAVKAAMETP